MFPIVNTTAVFRASLRRSPLVTFMRFKSHVKKITRAQRLLIKNVEKRRRNLVAAAIAGKPLPIVKAAPTFPVEENKFWKVVDNVKVYKNTSNGVRHRRIPVRYHLYKYGCLRRLSFGKRKTGGRNNTGKITVRGRGGGHKRRIRIVDFHRSVPGPHQVVRLEYDPNRSADLALMRNLSTNEFSYIIHPKDVQVGDILNSWKQGIPTPPPGESAIPKSQMVRPGNVMLLKDIPVGTLVHCIALKPGGKAQLCRSAGTYASVMHSGPTGYAQIRLSSKEIRLVSVECSATIGMVGNLDFHNRVLGKAGVARRLGRRPIVRGIAMSPVDHPHGGGRKSKGNKAPRSPWGWLTKGWRSVRRKKWYVVQPRWKA